MIKLVINISLLFLSVISFAQDWHFSQFYAVEMLLNPALTGRYKEDYRLSFIHRNQWSGIGSKFETSAFGAEYNLKNGLLGSNKIGFGLFAYKDAALNNTFTNNSFFLSTAYHKTLDHHKRHHISIGIQGGYVSKAISEDDFQFENQYQDWSFNPGLTSGENLEASQLSYIDIHVGGYYSFNLNDKTTLHAGVSAYDLTTPAESHVNSESENELGTRVVTHVGADYQLTNFIVLSPKILFVNQSNARDLNAGGLAAFNVGRKKDFTIFGGAWYRYQDAAILMTGVKYKNYDLKLSYDLTTSSLTQTKAIEGINANMLGAWEISLIIKGIVKRPIPIDYTVPCGIF